MSDKNQANPSQNATNDQDDLLSKINEYHRRTAVKTNENFGFLSDENPEKFNELLNNLRSEHNPITQTESILVRHMAEHEWLRGRALRIQSKLTESRTIADLPVYIRYETTHERGYYRALNELRKHRNERTKAEIGFESQKRENAAENRAVEALKIKKDAQILKREEFLWKKDVFEMKKKVKEQPTATQPASETASPGQQMAA